MIKLLILDRDGLINVSPSDINSEWRYILRKEDLILKDGVRDAFEILNSVNVFVVLASKQRSIDKGLISSSGVDEINSYLEELINFNFRSKYVEPKSKLKTRIIGQILSDYNDIKPEEMVFIDDCPDQVAVAEVFGITSICSDNLLQAVLSLEYNSEWIKSAS